MELATAAATANDTATMARPLGGEPVDVAMAAAKTEAVSRPTYTYPIVAVCRLSSSLPMSAEAERNPAQAGEALAADIAGRAGRRDASGAIALAAAMSASRTQYRRVNTLMSMAPFFFLAVLRFFAIDVCEKCVKREEKNTAR